METDLYKSSLNRGDRIGKGSYSVVFKGYRKDDASKIVAIKRIENDHDFFTENAAKDINALRAVTGHKNVVKLLDLHSDDEYIYIIMEYCEGGDLEDFLSNNNPPSYELKLDIMKQCAKGVAYIHGLNPPVVHRDIKCNNILLQNTPAGVVVKIGDFGLAKVFDQIDGDRNRILMSTAAGSMAFRAPEMCTSGRKQYNASVDIYGLGLVFNVLINYDGKDKLFEPHIANEPRDIYWPYSMRQVDAHTKKTPMPELFFTPVVKEKYPQIKAIITAMTRFDFNQRTDILLIKAQLKKECQENSKRNVAAEQAEAMELIKSQHDKQMRELNNRFSTLETEYNNEVQRRNTLEEWQEIAKRNAATEERKLISQHEKQIKEMNKRFSTLETEYNNEVEKRRKLESPEDEMKFHDEIDRGDESEGYNGKDQEDDCELSRTLAVEGITNDLDIEDLELYFESEKTSGGGSLQTINFDENSRMASLVFDNVLAVENILSREEHVIDGHSVTVKPYQPPNTERDDAEQAITKILITGIKPGTSGEMLQLLFESEKKSGGGEIKSFDLDQEGGKSAVLVYEDDKVAQRLLSKGAISFKNLELHIQPLQLPPSPAKSHDNSTKDALSMPSDEKSCARSIEVFGFGDGITTEYLHMFFGSSKQSSGGEIEHIDHNQDKKKAIITFKRESTVEAVLSRHQQKPLCIGRREITIHSVLDPSLPEIISCAVQVSGLPLNSSDEGIVMFFENRRMSGGGYVDEIVHRVQDGVTVITYKSYEVAQRVVEKHRSDPLRYGVSLLQVKMLCSNSRPSQVAGEKADQLLFLKNVAIDTDTEDIRRYLELLPQCQVQRCVFGITSGTVLVEFVTAPGYEEFYKLTCQKPLKGNMVDVQSVAKSREIEVYGITGLSSQKLQMYFEHHKSNGGEVEKVDILSNENRAIVTFVEFGVAEKVLSKTNHILEQKKLHVKQHYRCIGILPPDHDHTSPTTSAPVQTLIRQINPDILNFIMSTETNRRAYEAGVCEAGGRVVWPGEEVYEDAELAVECLLKREDHNYAEKVKAWEDEIQSECRRLLSGFITDHVNILQEGWREFMRQNPDITTAQMTKSDDLHVEVDEEFCTVVAIGKKTCVGGLMSKCRESLNSIESKLQKKKNMVIETVPIKPHVMIFLRAHKFMQDIRLSYKYMRIDPDLKGHKIVFTGLPMDIVNVKMQMYELIHQMQSETLILSPTICSQLKAKSTHEYIMSQFQAKHCIAVYDVSSYGNQVTVYTRTPEELSTAVAIVKNSLVAITTDVKGSLTQTFEKEMSESIKARIPLGGNKVLYIVQGDLTKYTVDAIVNATNNQMLHYGGVSLAIVNKGGAEIQRECTKYINTKGYLKKGQVYTSQAGKLPCKKVIHTVGPIWKGGNKNEVSDLYESVYVALQEASRLRLTTLAIPAISGGIFGFPKSVCCKTILEAVSDYLKKKRTSLKGVHIVDNNITLVDVFKQEAQKYVGKEAAHNHGGIEEPMDTYDMPLIPESVGIRRFYEPKKD